MFDSPFDDWMPGQPVLFGLPLHGRLDTTAPGSVRLTLPNSDTLDLFERGLFEHGGLVRFRDPRAVDVVRSEEDLAADIAAGREWRAEALMGPGPGVMYGARGLFQWIYHAAEQNWFAYFSPSFGRLTLGQTPRIGRGQRPEDLTIAATRVGQDRTPLPDSGGGFERVMSATPAGDRALIGIWGRIRISQGPVESIYAPVPSLLEVWEVRLTGLTAEYELLRSAEQCAGTVVVDPYPIGTPTSVGVVFGFSQSGPESWTSHIAMDEHPATGQQQVHWMEYDRDSWSYTQSGRVVSMYYGADGQPKEICLDLKLAEQRPRTSGGYIDAQTPATASGTHEPGSSFGATFVSGGNYVYGLQDSGSWHSLKTLRLVDAGVVRGEIVIDRQSTLNRRMHSTAKYTPYPSGNMPPSPLPEGSTSTVSNSRSESETVTLDGRVLSSLSFSISDNDYFIGVGGELPVVYDDLQVWKTFPALVGLLGVDTPELEGRELSIGMYGYSPQLMALVVRELMPAIAEPQAWHFGNAVHHGGSTPGSAQHAQLDQLYGAYNPITGEIVRDSLKPVSFV